MTHRTHHHSTPWVLLPFIALWKLLTFIIETVGRLVAVVIGAVFILVGIIISLTIVGAILGVPLALLGVLIILRGLF